MGKFQIFLITTGILAIFAPKVLGASIDFILNLATVIFLIIILIIFGWNGWTGFLTFLIIGGVMGLFTQR